jgi:RNA polymerase sigma-70 factor (ECF subfamily)
VLDDFDHVLAQARRGSPEAFQTLYDDLVRPVAAYLRGKGVADVEDVTSEVFLAVFTGLDRFSGGQPEFRSWVFTIAHRRVVDHWRRASRTPATSEYAPEDDTRTSPAAEDDALETLGTRRVHALLDTLTPDQREVLLLRVVADLTVEQVAEVVGKPGGAVKALQRRGLAALRKVVGTQGVPL